MSDAMNRIDAAVLVREAWIRLDSPQRNHYGGTFHAGGAYWRLSKVLTEFLEPVLPSVEGYEHANNLFKIHGRIAHDKRRVLTRADARDLTELIVQAATYESRPDLLRPIILRLIMSATKFRSELEVVE